MKKFLTFFLVVMLIATIGLAGCGTETPAPDDQQGSDAGDTADKNSLVYGRGGDTVSLDPAVVTDGESFKVTKNIYDTLVAYKGATTEIEPALAESWEDSEDGLTWTFKLREGVKFHDGTDFNADAVVFNFNRWINEDDPYRFDYGNYTYYPSMFGGTGENSVISEVVAEDDYTVKFTLTKPQGPFLNNLAMPPFGIASPAAFEKYGDKYNENPVGTGPFVFVKWDKNQSIVLKKNDNYWLEGYPLLDELIFKVIPDNSARFIALQSGEVDLIDNVNPDDVTLADKEENIKTWLRPSNNVGYLAFNVTVEPFDNPKVRQALSMAINKPALIKVFYNGLAEPAKNPMPPSLWGYNDEVTDYEYNLEAAKALLAEAGYPNGFETDFWYMPIARPYMPQGKKIAEAIQSDFEKIGVKVNLVTHDWAAYTTKASAGEHTMALMGWTGDNGDPDNFLCTLLDKDQANPDGNNIAQYANEEVHQLFMKAQQISDQAERTELYKQAQVIIHEEAPWAPLVHSKPPLLGNKNIDGFEPHPTGTDSFTKVSFK